MSLVAITQAGTRFDATMRTREQLRIARATERFVCQLCGGEMILKPGNVVIPHFAHKAGECSTNYDYHPQSLEHYAAKLYVADRLQEVYGDIKGICIEKEARLPEAMRVADVMISFPNGDREAHEAQLARLSTDDLQRRTEAYLSTGVSVVWYFGERSNTNENRLWCREHNIQFYQIQVASTTEGSNSLDERSYQYDGDGLRMAA